MLTVVAPSAVDLDASGAAAVLVRLTTTASGSDELPSNGAPRSRAATNRRGLEIELSSDGAVLDRATTDQHGHVTFQIAPARLGAPGPGTLTARFKGSSALSPTTGTSSWVRTTHVRLTGVARGDAVDDMTSVEIDGAVSTTFGDSDSSWALPEGLLVEVLDGAHPERPIGAAPIDANGVYRVQVDVLQRPSRLILRIANAPQHLVTSPHEIGLVHTFDWSRLGISALVAMLLGTVVVLARETRVSRERSESAKIEAGPVTLGRRDSLIPQRSEIAGSIIDAATGSAIEGARIAVTGTETSCIADSEGRFQVDVARLSGGAMELDITAPHYVRERVRVSVPHRGEWSGFTLRLTSLRLRVLGAHVRMSKAIDPDTRPGFTTIADTRALGGAEVDQLCDVIEASAYAEGTPHPEHVERIHQRAELVRDTKKD